MGRAARNVKGRVVLYADTITDSMKLAINENNRRRNKQIRSPMMKIILFQKL